MHPVEFAAVVPVGPQDREVERTRDLVDSLIVHEPRLRCLMLIDDSGRERDLCADMGLPPGCHGVTLANPGHGERDLIARLCSATLASLAWIRAHTAVDFVVRLDTDALVIAPFARKIADAFARLEGIGMVGSFDRTCQGNLRDFDLHAPRLKRLLSPLACMGRAATVRTHVRKALEQGYRLGEHCLGGAFAISAEMIRRMDERGYLQDPHLWRGARCPEDVMLGVYTRAVGLRSASLTAEGEPFGLAWLGLPDTPESLHRRGFSIVHSVKNDSRVYEGSIREFFRVQRTHPS